jgi:tRNA (cytidine/uridine-2'-O-)-methyltransferase
MGMPERILEKYPDRCYTIPMSGKVRSLNLSTAVGIVLFEAIRQVGRATLVPQPRPPRNRPRQPRS